MTVRSSESLHTAPTLLAIPMPPDADGNAVIGVYNFLTKSFATCSLEVLHWFSFFAEGRTVAEAGKSRPGIAADELDEQINALIDLGFLTQSGSREHLLHENYRKNWEWDTLAGAFHFSVLNNEFMSPEASASSQLERLEEKEPPELLWLPTLNRKVQLPVLDRSPALEHLRLLAKRRTNRTSAGHILTLQEIGDCLFSAFGVCQYVQTSVGKLPLSLAPSGGARNPYEPFVVVRRCEGLEEGVYHYSTSTHELAFVRNIPSDFSAATLLAGQEWADDMAAIIIMVAMLERTMWKYQDSNAYRVLLMEAGHKAQNLMTTATGHGLTACPTAALAHSCIQDLLDLPNSILHVPIYAITLDRALPYQDQIFPNPTFSAAFPKAGTEAVGLPATC